MSHDTTRDTAEAKAGASAEAAARPSILACFADAANLTTLAGVALGLLGMALAATGNLLLSASALMGAALCDALDGPIARWKGGRNPHFSPLGLYLDSIADAVVAGAGPALFLAAAGGFAPPFVVMAALVLCAVTMRLAYFTLFGLQDDNTRFIGFPVVYNLLAVGATALLIPFLSGDGHALVVLVVLLAVAAGNVSSVRVPKFRGPGLYGLVATLTVVGCLLLWMAWR